MNTKRVGNTSEAKLLAAFVEKGWVVLTPFGDNEPYDLVIDRGHGFEKVQVKTGRRNSNGCIIFRTCTTARDGSRSGYYSKADLFGVYFPESGKCYLIPVTENGMKESVTLRIDPPRNPVKRIRFASEFEI